MKYGLIRSTRSLVIPANAGIHVALIPRCGIPVWNLGGFRAVWIPASAGMTDGSERVRSSRGLVIPANAGTYVALIPRCGIPVWDLGGFRAVWVPASAGMTSNSDSNIYRNNG